MAKPDYIELLGDRETFHIPILYEDRSVIAIDKPAGWMLVPFNWQKTNRNLQAAITSSIAARDFWAKSRNLKFLRHVHRLDADTTGILLLATSPGAVHTYGDLFESRGMEKSYLVVVHGAPAQQEWVCRKKIGQDPVEFGRMRVDDRFGKSAETHFRVLKSRPDSTLLEARPYSGRTHQIRVHLLDAGHPVVGDDIYGQGPAPRGRRGGADRSAFPLGLRAVSLSYRNPFTGRPVRISAPPGLFLAAFRFRNEDLNPAGNHPSPSPGNDRGNDGPTNPPTPAERPPGALQPKIGSSGSPKETKEPKEQQRRGTFPGDPRSPRR